MTRAEALRGSFYELYAREACHEIFVGMTLDPAYASFTEDTLGSITRGKRADFVVLSQDIMSISAAKVLNTKVLATVIDGKVVFGDI